MKFKVGDRIAWYGSGGRHIAVVQSSTNSEGIFLVSDPRMPYNSFGLHPKQCRKLVRKECRRIWIAKEDVEQIPGHKGKCYPTDLRIWPAPITPNMVEFVEVRDKK